ncbi:restriction endonuclease subunit S [Lactobacillus iners]|uniref:restriction endonuclease subunit S n=1 Tax=Lactobacillus iners TaxID=147802 RepID=UPI000C80C999|nr:restriction endonuclease subunit S [Lactobacillus iners]MDK7317299.1 restriction endonuclease subunit S [Lactobacillus iners]MDK8131641.1 restriction endonuclease subunit S [Lactobacillus iners]MDK8317446.1 restriction endonuclease subunit S [Lactobacillus iners]MDK8324788.1 restriction endonuclease subunit S [Lactobacillus iners]MDK8582527.1 restriction endonuclease subunit S [Lactobacillus iners]
MKYKLSDICEYAKEKIKISDLDENTYISTENMLPNKSGITQAASLPTQEQTQAFMKNDVLVSNIRPYFKKIWFATFDGGCSNDVLVFRAKNGINSRFLHYVLSDDSFFDYSMATSKGTKMPRGDKKAIMEYEVPKLSYEEQSKIASILEVIDEKIELNSSINKNLEEQAATLFSENYFNRNYNVSKLEDIATIKYGKGLPTKKLTPKGFPVFGGNGVIGKYIHFMYDEPQILVSCRGAASGNIIETYPNSFVTNNSLVLEWNDYRYYEFYKQFLFANPLHTYATGSAQPQITIDNIKNVPFPCPKYDEIRELCSQLKSISALHFENIVESNKLSMLRDTLLPKLISGELDVSNLDI